MPLIRGQKMLAQQQQGHLRINDGNNTIVRRATIAIATTANMPVHQQQQCHHVKGNNASSMTCNKGKQSSLTTAEMPTH
jgi:hypothetical protein